MSSGVDILHEDDLPHDASISNQPDQLCDEMHSLSITSREDPPARRGLDVPPELLQRLDFNSPGFFQRRSQDGRQSSENSQRGSDSPVRHSLDSNGRRSSDSHSRRSLDPGDFPDYGAYLAARVCSIKRSMDPSSGSGHDVLDEIYEVQDLEFEEEDIEDIDPEDFPDFEAFRERYNTMLDRAKYNYEMGKSNIHLQ